MNFYSQNTRATKKVDVFYTIRDLEKLTGIKSHTIRIWEQRYNIIQPNRTDTNHRRYSEDQLKKLLNIAFLNKKGYKISKLATLTEKELGEKVFDISSSQKDDDSEIDSLVIAMLDSDEQKFQSIFNNSIIKSGFENTIKDLINPLFDKIGMLWQSKTITSPHEHFVSNIIRQKIIASLDSVPNQLKENFKTFVLFLPNREWHEIGLLYSNYLLKKRGHKTIYLGASVPIDDLKEYTRYANYDFLLTSVNSTNSYKDLQIFLNNLSESFSNSTILISGYQFFVNSVKFPKNIIFLKNFDQLMDFSEKNR